MKRLLIPLLVLSLAPVSFGEMDEALTKRITEVLKECQTVKPGHTREQLLKVFTTEGGISTATQQTFVHPACPYIKVRVEFKTLAPPPEVPEGNPGDKITKISQPYLEWSILD